MDERDEIILEYPNHRSLDEIIEDYLDKDFYIHEHMRKEAIELIKQEKGEGLKLNRQIPSEIKFLIKFMNRGKHD